jgi:hypothetical protein
MYVGLEFEEAVLCSFLVLHSPQNRQAEENDLGDEVRDRVMDVPQGDPSFLSSPLSRTTTPAPSLLDIY